jgi:hypothetical protein
MTAVFFNNAMGGVDAADARMAAKTTNRPRTRKWTTKVWFYVVDVACNNAYVLLSKFGTDVHECVKNFCGKRSVDRQFFTETLSRELIERGLGSTIEDVQAVGGRGTAHCPVQVDGRGDGAKRGYCSFDGCGKRSVNTCSICGVTLCYTAARNCFQAYHDAMNRQ